MRERPQNVIPAKQSVREYRICEKQSDEAISILCIIKYLLDSRRRESDRLDHSHSDWRALGKESIRLML